jgi:DNA modification methylase
MKLTDNEKRDAVRFIEEGKPLPEKYRFLLFDESKQVELTWNGKSDEVTNVVLPFQIIEHVDEPRTETKNLSQDSFEFTSGRQVSGWTNNLIWGDNKYILSSLKNGPMRDEIEKNGGIKLIYIDPPFDVGADFSMNIEIGESSFEKQPNVLEHIAYRDTWGKGEDSFLSMIYERLLLMRDLLADDGSIYLHCDWRLNSSIRIIMDEVFGKNNFQNEIIWHYVKGASSRERYGKKYNSIFYYAKTKKYIFNLDEVSVPYNPETIARARRGMARYDVDADELESRGKNPGDVWVDIHPLQGNSIENVFYPTQKPEKLIERIIKGSSRTGDIICDFFIGSGTTAAVAEKLGRKWICSDLGKFGIHTTRKRLINIQRELKKDGKDYRAFEILNLGKYQREHFIYDGKNERDELKQQEKIQQENDFKSLILEAYKATEVQGFNTLHGKKGFEFRSSQSSII